MTPRDSDARIRLLDLTTLDNKRQLTTSTAADRLPPLEAKTNFKKQAAWRKGSKESLVVLGRANQRWQNTRRRKLGCATWSRSEDCWRDVW